MSNIMTRHTLEILQYHHRKIFKVCLARVFSKKKNSYISEGNLRSLKNKNVLYFLEKKLYI